MEATGAGLISQDDSDAQDLAKGMSWEEAKLQATQWATTRRSNVENANRHGMIDSIGFKLKSEAALELGKDYGELITAAEFYWSSRDPLFADKQSLAIGRAKGPCYRWVELGDKLGCTGPLGGASSCREARVWASISGKLRVGSKIVHTSTDRAKKQLEAVDKELASNVHNLGVWAE